MKSFINVALSSWCFCFFSCVVEDSTSSNSSIIQQSSGLHNSHLSNADSSLIKEGGCTTNTLSVFVMLFMELI